MNLTRTLVSSLVALFGTAALAHGPAGHAPAPTKAQSGGVVVVVVDVSCPADKANECTKQKLKEGGAISLTETGSTTKVRVVAAPGKSLEGLLGTGVGIRAELIGKVTGTGAERTITVERALIEHEHTTHHGGVVVMHGDLHVEVLALRSGEVRAYVSDGFRRPMTVAGKAGTLEVKGGKGPVRKARLQPSAKGEYLVARVGRLVTREVEVTARFPLDNDPDYSVTMAVQPQSAASADGHAHAPVRAAAPSTKEVVVNVTGEYAPNVIHLKKGQPVKLTFHRKTTSGCSRELLIPAFGVKRELHAMKQTEIEFTPDKVGEFEFTCGMEMMRGKLVVTQ